LLLGTGMPAASVSVQRREAGVLLCVVCQLGAGRQGEEGNIRHLHPSPPHTHTQQQPHILHPLCCADAACPRHVQTQPHTTHRQAQIPPTTTTLQQPHNDAAAVPCLCCPPRISYPAHTYTPRHLPTTPTPTTSSHTSCRRCAMLLLPSSRVGALHVDRPYTHKRVALRQSTCSAPALLVGSNSLTSL
jgi:hypothetical protein